MCVCVIWGRSESQETGPLCAVGSNEGGNEGLGFQSCHLQVHHAWAQERVVGINEDREASSDSSEQPSVSNYHTGRSDTVGFSQWCLLYNYIIMQL